jgi:hypothetical protein
LLLYNMAATEHAMTATISSSEHRKIDLQSPADLAHIHTQLSRAARDKIDRALPPAAAPEGAEDLLRRRVEELVDGYVRELWDGVRQNVRVNGMDAVAARTNTDAQQAAVDGGSEEQGAVDTEDGMSVHFSAPRLLFAQITSVCRFKCQERLD